jgi:hypothetical protein
MKLLYPKPKKLNFELETYEMAEEHRKVNCIFYGICLDHAAYLRWEGFSCKNCKFYFDENIPIKFSEAQIKKFTLLMKMKRRKENE